MTELDLQSPAGAPAMDAVVCALQVLVMRMAGELERLAPGALERLGGPSLDGRDHHPDAEAMAVEVDDHVSLLLAQARADISPQRQ